MKKKRWIPFSWMPASWGLVGTTRQIAEAEYYYTGEDLERKLKDIEMASLPEDDPRVKQYKLDQLHAAGKLTDNEYAKQSATLQGVGWVKPIDFGFENGYLQGQFELDWNDKFVSELEEAGYGPHPSPEDTVDEWFSELCRNVALEKYDGIGDYSERLTTNRGVHQDVIFRSDLEDNKKGKDKK